MSWSSIRSRRSWPSSAAAASRKRRRRCTCPSRPSAGGSSCSNGSWAHRCSNASAGAALHGTDRGTVTLALVGTLASTALTQRLREFRDAHPAVDLRLRTALSAEVSALVRRGDAALGLRYEVDTHPELVSTTIHQERLVPVCAPDHRLARARRVSPRALAGERWIAFPPRPEWPAEPYSAAVAQ